MITIEQIKAARALLGWRQAKLAEMIDMSATAIANIERKAVDPRSSSLRSIEEALSKAGIEFLDEDETKGVGVRLRKKQKK